jgi:hypothetical protein
MASFTERLKIILDLETQKVETGLKKVRDQVKEADGVFGKLKAGAKGLSDQFTGNPAAMVATAGAAAGELFHLADQASKTGTEIGNLRDATGLSADAASRWVEVANDMGIGSDKVAGLIEKMTKNLGTSPDKFAALGIEVKKAGDGTADMSGTLLNAIEVLHNIQDPTEKAKVGAQLFGKSWGDASELIAAGADKVNEKLKGVGGGAIFSDKEIAQAREFRDMMANLKDVGEHLSLSIGKGLIPVITEFSSELETVGKVMDKLPVGKIIEGLNDLGNPLAAATDALDKAKEHMGHAFETEPLDVWMEHIGRFKGDELKHQIKLWVDAHKDAGLTVEDVTKKIDLEGESMGRQLQSLRDSEAGIKTNKDATKEMTQAAKDAAEAQKAEEQSTKDLDTATKNYATSVEKLYQDELNRLGLKEQITTMLADWKDGHNKTYDAAVKLAEAEATLQDGTLNSRDAIQHQIDVLSVLETTTKEGSPLWKAIEAHKQGLKEAADQAERIQAAEAGLNAQAANAAAGGAPGVFGAPVTVPKGGRGPEGAGYSVVNINVTQKITPTELIAIAQEAQRRFGVGVFR